MYIIDKNGKKFDLPKEAEFNNFMQNAPVLDNDVTLVDAWVAYFNKKNFDTDEYEYIKEVRFYHEPTNEELLYYMSKLELEYNDYVEIVRIKVLKFNP